MLLQYGEFKVGSTAPDPVKAHVLVTTILQKIYFDNLKTQ